MTFIRSAVSSLFIIGIMLSAYFFLFEPHQRNQISLLEKQTQISQNLSRLSDQINTLERATFAATMPQALLRFGLAKTDVELAFQEEVIEAAYDQNINLISFGSSSINRETTQDFIAFEFEGEGALTDVYRFIAALEATTPKIAVANLSLRPSRQFSELETDLTMFIQGTVWTFWDIQQ